MKKMLLTSSGIKNEVLLNELKELIKPNRIEDIKVLFIPTAASRTVEEMEWSCSNFEFLVDMGIRRPNITFYNLNYDLTKEKLNQFNMVYVLGGNTFYLMKRLKETGFDQKMIDLVNNGCVYVGTSAGSIVTGDTVETALPFDENDCGLEDFTGMKLFPGIVLPHYDKSRELISEIYKQIYQSEVSTVNDDAAIVVNGDNIKKIGHQNNNLSYEEIFEKLGVQTEIELLVGKRFDIYIYSLMIAFSIPNYTLKEASEKLLQLLYKLNYRQEHIEYILNYFSIGYQLYETFKKEQQTTSSGVRHK